MVLYLRIGALNMGQTQQTPSYHHSRPYGSACRGIYFRPMSVVTVQVRKKHCPPCCNSAADQTRQPHPPPRGSATVEAVVCNNKLQLSAFQSNIALQHEGNRRQQHLHNIMALQRAQDDSDDNCNDVSHSELCFKRVFIGKIRGQNNRNIKKWMKKYNIDIQCRLDHMYCTLEISGEDPQVKKAMAMIKSEYSPFLIPEIKPKNDEFKDHFESTSTESVRNFAFVLKSSVIFLECNAIYL